MSRSEWREREPVEADFVSRRFVKTYRQPGGPEMDVLVELSIGEGHHEQGIAQLLAEVDQMFAVEDDDESGDESEPLVFDSTIDELTTWLNTRYRDN